MLTRFVRTQLIIFTIASIIGVAVMVFAYIQAPTLLGIGRITVTLELPATGGLYRFSNVTYRGVQVGKVTAVALTPNGAKATLSLDTSPKIPADLQAEVRSVSAVGEQYVDLRPRTDSGPYLQNGSVIAMASTTIPQSVGPMLDQVSALVGSIPKDKLSGLLDESFKGFNGAGFDLGSLFDSSATVAADLDGVADNTRTLFDDTAPLLDSQLQTTDEIRVWARSLAGITDQIATNDPQVRTLLQQGPGAADEVSQLLNQVKPTLPVLLANLTSLGQVLVTYNAGLEQLLVLMPPSLAFFQAASPMNNATGYQLGGFNMGINDPTACNVGFLPPSQWRSPADTSDMDTPDGLYCKLPQDSPLSVRGARNYPCAGQPGKRAPTVELCKSDKPYMPLAMRQHTLGPYPFDPNLVSQGIPLDDRVTFEENIHAPIEGTPLPPGLAPPPGPPAPAAPLPPGPPAPAAPLPPGPPAPAALPPPGPPAPAALPPAAPPAHLPPPALAPTPPPGTGDGAVPVTPSSFGTGGAGMGPSVAQAQYNPLTGTYVAPDGRLFRQTGLGADGAPKTWQDLLPT